jgi:hypothetical protein
VAGIIGAATMISYVFGLLRDKIIGVFFASAYLLKSPESHSLINMLQKRLTRP